MTIWGVTPRIQLSSFPCRVPIPSGPKWCLDPYKTVLMSLPNAGREMIVVSGGGATLGVSMSQPARENLLMLGSFTAAFQVWLSSCFQGLPKMPSLM